MSEKELSGQIRFSYGINPWRAIIKSLGVMLVLSVIVLFGDVIAFGETSLPLVSIVLLLLIGINLLGYVELAVSSPRKGGAYRLVQTCEESNLLAFITGWILILAGICAGGLLIQAFGLQGSALLINLTGFEVPWSFLSLGILFTTAGLKLLPSSKKWQDFLLISLFIIILVSTLFALPDFQLSKISPVKGNWRSAFSLLLIPYIGLELASGLLGDLRDRTKDAPWVLITPPLLSGLITTLFGILIIGSLGTAFSSTWQNPLADLLDNVGGKWLGGVIAGLSLAMIPFALDRILSLLIKLVFGMTRDGFWPENISLSTRRFNIPLRLLLILVTFIGTTIILPLSNLAGLGGLFYLLVLISVNFSLARQEQISSRFQLPIHPWIPALVVIFDILVLLLWAEHLPLGAVLVSLGLIIYFAYGRHHSVEAKEGTTVFKTELVGEETKQHTRILVPIANPETAESLLHLAGTLVRPEGGKVIALRVITVPSQLPLSDGKAQAEADRILLDQAIDQATKEEFRVQTMSRVSRSVAEGILDTAREEDVDQILVGWAGGETRSITKSMGPVLDPIIKEASCDVLVVKGFNWKDIKSILVPTAGGPNSTIGADLASTLSHSTGAKITGLYVQVGRASESRMTENQRILEKTFLGLSPSHEPELKIITANSVEAGILKESENHDLVIVGASEQGFIDQFAFGSIPQRIASQTPISSVMVKGFGGTPDFWFRKVIRMLFNLFPTLSTEEQLEVREDIIDDAQPGRDYFILIGLSSIIATLGLLLNSPAVVIGAMLVAPLMSPILGFSLGIVLGEVRLIRTSLESVFKGVMATIIVSILVGLISPLKQMTPEILARTQPTLLDLFIALASGMAGAYALSRKDVSAALPGVAIAAALAPPLSVVGLGFAHGNFQVAGGALLLFVTNIITISLAGVIIFSLLGIHPLSLQPETKRRVRRGIIGVTFLVVMITIPLAIIMAGIIQQSRLDQTIEQVLLESPILEESTILEINKSQIGDNLQISTTISSQNPITQQQVSDLALELEGELDLSVNLEVILLPVIFSE
jgi:uncharacterized hydrophobic protein (TIGR00271 family)